MQTNVVHQVDCLEWMREQPDDCVDLVFCSPPYEDVRLYGELKFKLKGQEWVDWCVPRYLECVRICRGMVCWVVDGKTKDFRWSATPALLMADLHRAGVRLRKPHIFKRWGVPGKRVDSWRSLYESVVCSSKGKLPWADPLATKVPTKYKKGGAFSNRKTNGTRVSGGPANAGRPEFRNPGDIVEGPVGGGRMGSNLAHLSEAPFPEWLVSPYVQCFCPPEGIVLDIFSGSGTTLKVAADYGRKFIGCDAREDQVTLSRRRVAELKSA